MTAFLMGTLDYGSIVPLLSGIRQEISVFVTALRYVSKDKGM